MVSLCHSISPSYIRPVLMCKRHPLQTTMRNLSMGVAKNDTTYGKQWIFFFGRKTSEDDEYSKKNSRTCHFKIIKHSVVAICSDTLPQLEDVLSRVGRNCQSLSRAAGARVCDENGARRIFSHRSLVVELQFNGINKCQNEGERWKWKQGHRYIYY